ncbi:MAG: T9SS type A sorting domain-containing protein [Bacteroidales bacterium]|nr:T9SS type A sorting domain-containing protein [Bacteroidales bacterium]
MLGSVYVYANSITGDLKDSCLIIIGNSTNITRENESKVSVYPNPCIQDKFVLMGLGNKNYKIVLSDLIGKTVYILESDKDEIKIENLKLTPGLYFINILRNNEKITLKLRVE